MANRKNKTDAPEPTSSTVGYEARLWQMADALRGSMEAAEYKHVVIRLIFLKYTGQVLFLDARKLGRMVDRTCRELTDEDIAPIANTYHAWRGNVGSGARPARASCLTGPRACPG